MAATPACARPRASCRTPRPAHSWPARTAHQRQAMLGPSVPVAVRGCQPFAAFPEGDGAPTCKYSIESSRGAVSVQVRTPAPALLVAVAAKQGAQPCPALCRHGGVGQSSTSPGARRHQDAPALRKEAVANRSFGPGERLLRRRRGRALLLAWRLSISDLCQEILLEGDLQSSWAVSF